MEFSLRLVGFPEISWKIIARKERGQRWSEEEVAGSG